MPSEYDPLRPRKLLSAEASDLDKVKSQFAEASSGYLRSPVPWLAWAIILPGTALLTPHVAAAVGAGSMAVLFMWSVAILIGGAVEGLAMRGARKKAARSEISGWVFRAQGNLSLIAIALTVVVVVNGAFRYIPGIWLLLIGHSFYAVGGLASNALRRSGLIYQLGGVISLLPWLDSLTVFAVTTAVANLAVAVALLRARSTT
ncbi:MAG: hypothetical protein ACE5GX_05770 [Thermoanaerobaculia bacterium]